MSVDTATVKKVASLARIAIDDAAAERLVPELNNI
ncbi:MAG TPA: Asp-tRNA(Asn)/Glu-tRNA(Gln) amidotransferase GatCAB subunit C, partial [Sphingomonas sp.]|nr:Asp-tRNA(Asn)/Glu-tRNA(Gln) amidotransferase GatCAB subunit C [Sphingomonas sp.]